MPGTGAALGDLVEAGAAGVLLFLGLALALALALTAALLTDVLARRAKRRQGEPLQLREVHPLQTDRGFEILLIIDSRFGVTGFLGQQPEMLPRFLHGQEPFLRGGAFESHQPAGVVLGAGKSAANLAFERAFRATVLSLPEERLHLLDRLGQLPRVHARAGLREPQL